MSDNIRKSFPSKIDAEDSIDSMADHRLDDILIKLEKKVLAGLPVKVNSFDFGHIYGDPVADVAKKKFVNFLESKGYTVKHECGSDQRENSSWDYYIIS